MLIRNKKTKTWDEDSALAVKLLPLVQKTIKDPNQYVDLLTQYAAEYTEVSHSPEKEYCDGYAANSLWLETERAERKAELSLINEKKMLKFEEIHTTGVGIIITETLMYLCTDGKMNEQKRFTVLHVNDGKLIGELVYQDDEPEYVTKAKEEAGKAAAAATGLVPDKTDLWPDNQGQSKEDWLYDVASAKYFSSTMQALYTECDETRIFMHRAVAQNIFTRQYPPLIGREGKGDRDYWLNCEYATRVASKNSLPLKKNLKHVNIFSIGSTIIFDEDRVYRLEDDTIFYLRNTIVMPVKDGAIIGFECFLEMYPGNVLPEKIAIFKKAQEGIKAPPLDYSMLPYVE